MNGGLKKEKAAHISQIFILYILKSKFTFAEEKNYKIILCA